MQNMLRLRTTPSFHLKPIINVRVIGVPKITFQTKVSALHQHSYATFANLKSGAAKFKRLVTAETKNKRVKRPQQAESRFTSTDRFTPTDNEPEQFEQDELKEDFNYIKDTAKGKAKKKVESMLFEEDVNEKVEEDLNLKNKPKESVPFKKIVQKKQETRQKMKKNWQNAKKQEEEQIQLAQKHHLERIQKLAHIKQIAEAENEFQTMIVNQIPISRSIYRAMMEMYLDNGNYDRVKQLFDEMSNTTERPDGKTYSLIIAAYARSGDTETSIKLFQEMLQDKILPTEHTFNQIISSYVQKGDTENAMHYFRKMKKYDLEPSGFTYDILLRIFPDNDSMKKYIDEAKAQTDPVALNFAVAVAGKMQSGQLITNLFETMKKNNVTPSQLAYNVAIQNFGLKGNTKKMLEHFMEMQKYGYLVDVSLIKLMLSILRKTNDVEVVQVIQKQIRDLGMTISPSMYSSLIECYSRANDFTTVWNLFQEMVKKNVPVSALAANRLVDACGFNNQHEKLDQLVHHYNFPKDKYFHKCLAGAYLRCGNFAAAVDVIRTCRQQNVPWKMKLVLPFVSRMKHALELPQVEPLKDKINQLWDALKERKTKQNRNDLGSKEIALTEELLEQLHKIAPTVNPTQLRELMMNVAEAQDEQEE